MAVVCNNLNTSQSFNIEQLQFSNNLRTKYIKQCATSAVSFVQFENQHSFSQAGSHCIVAIVTTVSNIGYHQQQYNTRSTSLKYI